MPVHRPASQQHAVDDGQQGVGAGGERGATLEARERARDLSGYWEDGVHSLKGLPNVIDLRNLGLVAGIELEPRPGKPAARAFEAFLSCYEKGVLVRTTADTIALSPPLIVEKGHIDQIFGTIAGVLKTLN